jgi:hypothetical protein
MDFRFELVLGGKSPTKIKKNKLTSEMKIDSLKKFAKTSPAAEAIPDRLKPSRKEVERGI